MDSRKSTLSLISNSSKSNGEGETEKRNPQIQPHADQYLLCIKCQHKVLCGGTQEGSIIPREKTRNIHRGGDMKDVISLCKATLKSSGMESDQYHETRAEVPNLNDTVHLRGIQKWEQGMWLAEYLGEHYSFSEGGKQ